MHDFMISNLKKKIIFGSAQSSCTKPGYHHKHDGNCFYYYY